MNTYIIGTSRDECTILHRRIHLINQVMWIISYVKHQMLWLWPILVAERQIIDLCTALFSNVMPNRALSNRYKDDPDDLVI